MSSPGSLSELDALRSQVADLSIQLAERDRSAQDLREQSNLLRTIVNGTATETGEEFFTTLVTQLTSRLHIQYAIIGEVQGDHTKKIRTLAVSAGDTVVDNFDYELTHTPCATALAQSYACFNQNVQETFPQFQRLADLGAESYCAVSIRTKDGAVVGLLVVMDTKPLVNSADVQSLLAVFAPRIAAEFERRRAEQERAQALADLHNVIETIPDIVFTLDTQGNVVKWNRRLGDVTGYSSEELLNKPALAFVPPEEQARTAAAIQRVFVEGYAELEGHLLTKEHRLIPYHWTGALLKNHHGEPVGITGIGRDVSEQKRAEEALRRSEERFALAVEGSNDIFWDAHRLPGEPWYAPHTPVWWSLRIRELLGLEESDLFDTFEQWITRLHPADKDRVFGQLAAHIEQRVPYDVEYRLRTNAGDYRWIRGRGQALWDELGEPLRMSGSCQDITERKRIEQALHASEERFNLAVRGSSTGIWDWDLETNNVYFSPLWKSMLGYEDHELRGEFVEWEKRLHPDDRERALATVRSYLEGTTPQYELEHRLRHKDGSYRWILARGVSLSNAEGAPYRMAGSHVDITDRKRAEEALWKSEEHLRAIFQNTAVGIAVGSHTTGTGIDQVNPAFAAMLGYTPEELCHLGMKGLTFPDDIPASKELVTQLVEGTRSHGTIEKRYVKKDGSLVWAQTTVSSIFDKHGRYLSSIALIQDITERKRADMALRASEERYRTLYDDTPTMYFTLATDGMVRSVNRFGAEQLGYQVEELVGHSVLAVFHEEDKETVAASLSECLTTPETTRRWELRKVRKNGDIIWVRETVRVGQSSTGETVVLVMCEDITKRRQTEEALLRSEERFRTMFTQAPIGMALIDSLTGQIYEANPKNAQIAGRTTEEMSSIDWMSITHPDDVQADLDNMARLNAGDIAGFQMEKRYVRPDGTVAWVKLTVAPIRVEAHTGPRHLAMIEDITQRKQEEQDRQELHLALANAMPGIARLDSHGRYLSINEMYASALGYDPAELIGETWSPTVFPDDRPKAESAFASMLQEGKGEFEARALRKDGSTFWKQVLMVKITDHEGHHLGHHCFMRDITERKELERIRREHQERLALAMEIAELATWDWNIQTNQVIWSENCEQVKRLPLGSFEGTFEAYQRLVHPDDLPELLRRIEQALRQGAPYYTEHRIISPSGEVQWVEGNGRVYRNETGHPVRMIGTVCNFTERKQTEEALRKSEEQYARATAVGKVGVWELDVVTGTYHGDANLKALFGYIGDELSTDPYVWLNLVHPDDQSIAMDSWQRIVNGEMDDSNYEIRMLKKDGTVIWTDVRGHAVRDHEGQVTQFFGATVDISERKQAEVALAQSERQLRTVLDALPVGVWFTDQSGKVLLANPAARQIWSGIKQVGIETSVNGAGWWETIGPTSAFHRWALGQAVTRGVASLNEALTLECLDGTKKTVRNSTVPVQGEDGVILGAIVLNEDLSPLRLAQEALALTQFSVDHAVEGFFWIDPDAMILSVNESACRMLEYTRDELTTMTVHDIDPNLPPDLWPIHWEDVKRKGSVTFESKYWSRTGLVMDTEITFNYLLHDGAEYNCAIVRDITQRKRDEDLLRESEQAIRALHEAAATPGLSYDERIQAVLEVGCRRFKLSIGVLTKVVGEVLEFTHIWAPGTNFTAGMAVPLSTTYCQTTLQSTGPVCVEHAGQSDWRNHPGYEALGLECYLGTKLLELDHVQGTVCFLGEDPHTPPFSQADKNFLQLMARWITGELERREAEQALKESEARYHALYDDTPTMYFTLAMDGMVRSVNRFGAEQLGYQVEELVGHSVLNIFHKDDREVVAARLSECLATPEGTRHWEFRKVRKDGSVIWVRETARASQSSTGETVVLVTCEDITERRRMEEAFRKSEQYNRILFENSPIGLVLCQLDGTIVDCNERYIEILGQSFSDILGKTYWELTSKQYDEQAQVVMETLCRTGRFGPYEKEYIHADGHLVPVRLFGALIEKDGELFMNCCVEDVTDRKRAEQELQKSHAFLRQIIDTDPNFIFAKDREGRFTLVNKAVADAYGTTVENLIDKTDADFNPNQEEVAFFRQKDLAVLDSGQEFFLPEEVITDVSGRTRWLQTVKRPLLDDEGRATMVLGASTDITDRKCVEEALRQRERELRAALEERERISEDLHDGILQMLFAVGLSLETAKSMMPARARKTAAQPLDQAIQQLNIVMREIRNFIAGLGSDLLQGKDLTLVLKQMLASLTENQSTNVRLAVDDRAAKALSTEQSLHLVRVIQEAVSNCIQHGRASEARVSLKLLKQGVRLSVRDNGCGFNQAGAKRTGHGLRNMASRAKKIGGKFSVLSKVNEGTRIVFDVPRETADVSR